MNLLKDEDVIRVAICWLVITAALVVLGVVPLAKADTILTYTGNDYSQCAGTYCTGGPYALHVTLDTTLAGSALDNLSFENILSTVKSITFTDESGLTVQNSWSESIYISTNASGNVETWFVGACGATCDVQMQTNWDSPIGFNPGNDFSETAANFSGSWGESYADPGTWVMTPVPEPGSLLIFGIGLLTLGGSLKRKLLS